MKSLGELEEALKRFDKENHESAKALRELAEGAEETGDYYDYDQACYDTWERMAEQGEWLAEAVRGYIEFKKGTAVPTEAGE